MKRRREDPVDLQLLAELSAPGTVFLLANEDKLPTLPQEIEERMSVVYSTRLSRRRVLLVTNGEHPEAEPLAPAAEP